MLRVVKVRLYPNKEQQTLIHKTFGSCRFVYNKMLDSKIKAHKNDIKISTYELKKTLVPMKKEENTKFLSEVDSTALQNSVLNLDKSYKNFFRRVKLGEKSGFPKFKSKHNSQQSYQTSTAKIKNAKLYLPIIGEVKTKFHRGDVKGKIKTVTVSCEANQYFACINYEDALIESNKVNNGKHIAIDVGVKVFAYTSENEIINPNKEHSLENDIKKMIKAKRF